MPISYNPGVQDISGQLFAQNAAPGYAALAQGIKERGEQHEKDLKNARIAQATVKNNPALLKQLGMTEDQFMLMDGKAQADAVTGAYMALGRTQQQQEMAAKMQELAARAAAERNRGEAEANKSLWYQGRAAGSKAFGDALRTYGQSYIPGGPTDEDGNPVPLTEEQRQSRAYLTPGLDKEGGAQLLQHFSTLNAARMKNDKPATMVIDGKTFVLSPGGGWRLVEDSKSPAGTVTSLPGGLGSLVATGGGKGTLVKPAKDRSRAPGPNESLDRPLIVNGQVVPGMAIHWSDKDGEWKTVRTAAGGGVQTSDMTGIPGGAAGAAAGSVPPSALINPLGSVLGGLMNRGAPTALPRLGGVPPALPPPAAPQALSAAPLPPPAAAPAPAAAAPGGPVAGMQVQQGNDTYEFDGQNWIKQ